MDDPFAVHPAYECPDCKRVWGPLIGQGASSRVCMPCLGQEQGGDVVKGLKLGPLGTIRPFKPTKAGLIPMEAIPADLRPMLDTFPEIGKNVEGWEPQPVPFAREPAGIVPVPGSAMIAPLATEPQPPMFGFIHSPEPRPSASPETLAQEAEKGDHFVYPDGSTTTVVPDDGEKITSAEMADMWPDPLPGPGPTPDAYARGFAHGSLTEIDNLRVMLDLRRQVLNTYAKRLDTLEKETPCPTTPPSPATASQPATEPRSTTPSASPQTPTDSPRPSDSSSLRDTSPSEASPLPPPGTPAS